MIHYQTSTGFLTRFTMIWKAVILLSFALNVLGKEIATSEQHVKINHKKHDGHHGELSHIGSKEPEHHEEYAWAYPSYEFSYKVHDPHTHDMKGQEEHRDGDKVKGEYWLIEPNGHKRTVKYHADKHSGFHATVHYSDDYHHHEHKEEESKEEEEKEEAHEEEKKEEEHSDDKHVKESEESHEHEEKKEAEEEEKGSSDGEESRGHEEIGKWIHDHHWGHRGDKHRYEVKYDHHDDDKHYHGHKNAPYAKISHLGHKHKAGHKNSENYDMFTGLGSYENRHGHKDYHGDNERHQESRARPAYHGLDAPHAYRQRKNKAIVRENYVHPRYYRQSI